MSDIAIHPSAAGAYLYIGAGLRNAKYEQIPLTVPKDSSRVHAVKNALEALPIRKESWWSLHIWKGGTRSKSNWIASHGVFLDVDYHDAAGLHASLPSAVQEALLPVLNDKFEGNLFHFTPRGFRAVYIFDKPLTDAALWREFSKVAQDSLVETINNVRLASGELRVDNSVQYDLGRLVYAPNAIVNNIQRQAEVVVTEAQPLTFDWFGFRIPHIIQKADLWNDRNGERADDWPDSGGECPMCGHDKCFGRMKDEESKWFCFSANHGVDSGYIGKQTDKGWIGNILDMEAGMQKCSRVEVLLQNGYFVETPKTKDAAGKQREIDEDDPNFQRLIEDMAVIDGTTTIVDTKTKQIYKADAFRLMYAPYYMKWSTHEERRSVKTSQIVFSPQGCEPGEVNLWQGMPTKPKTGECARIVEHVYNMANFDLDLAHHIFCWLAWPLKHPGTKMGYAIVIHGGQGTGKSLFFERLMMQIYGLQYSIQIGQTEIESNYTGWLSQKLYVVCNEVASNHAERKHSRNRLKSIITDKWFAIEEKFMPVRVEENHANLVFLSNENQPVLPEVDDRRYEIIRFDKKESYDYYSALANEIDNGGAQAFYQYLLEYDCGAYTGPNEKPALTEARETLISTSRTPPEQFIVEWRNNETPFPFVCVSADDLWHAYRLWCRNNGYYAGTKNAFGRSISLSPLSRDFGMGVTTVDTKTVRFREVPTVSDMNKAGQIRAFAEAYNDAYLNYNTRLKM